MFLKSVVEFPKLYADQFLYVLKVKTSYQKLRVG